MTTTFAPATGEWWRFTRYEVRGKSIDTRWGLGYIGPAADAVLERYDPWEAYYQAKDDQGGKKAPHEELLELAKRRWLTKTRGHGATFESDLGYDNIVDWCNRYGLLGILPFQTLAVTLAPRWEPILEDKAPTKDDLFPTVIQYRESPTGFIAKPQGTLALPFSPDIPKERGGAVPKEYWGGLWPSHDDGCVFRDLTRPGIYHEKTRHQTWHTFFPTVPKKAAETYPYPEILSEDFWRLYSEPLYTFVRAVSALQTGLEQLTAPIDAGSLQWHSLNHMASTLSPWLDPRAKVLRWQSRSLLSSLAMMCLLDVAQGSQPYQCPICHGVFLSDSARVLYCSPKCRRTAQKRAYRHRKRVSEETEAAGQA